MMPVFVFGFFCAAFISFLVWAGGGTFWQRCAKAFPDLPYAQHERCKAFLVEGGKLWEFQP